MGILSLSSSLRNATLSRVNTTNSGVVPWFVPLKGHPFFNQKSAEYMKKVHIFARVVHELSKILLDLKIKFFLHNQMILLFQLFHNFAFLEV